MKNLATRVTLLLLIVSQLIGCTRDLSPSMYTSDSTLNIVLSGVVVSSRMVKIKDSDNPSDGRGALAGGVLGAGGGALASNGRAEGIVGGAVAGAAIGALAQRATNTSSGREYIVKVDTSKLGNDYYEGSALMRNSLAAAKATGTITVVQEREKKNDVALEIGQKVFVIVSENRTRVIPDPTGN
jgi:outer membrane lipoprotein SlyB